MFQNPYSTHEDLYEPHELYARIYTLESVIASCVSCTQVESMMPLKVPTCLQLKAIEKPVPPVPVQPKRGKKNQKPSGGQSHVNLNVTDKRLTQLVRMKDKLMKDRIENYHTSESFFNIIKATQNLSTCQWGLMRMVCSFDMIMHDEMAVMGREAENQYTELNILLTSELKNLENKVKDDMENLYHKVTDWANQKISKLKKVYEKPGSVKELSELQPGAHLVLAKQLTEIIHYLHKLYSLSFDYKRLDYNLDEKALIEQVTYQ